MKKTMSVFTVVFLLLAISAAAFRPLSIHTVHHDDVSNDVVLTTTESSSSSDPPKEGQITTTSEEAAVRLPETTTQTLFVTRPTTMIHHHHPFRFSRSNQINRHFYNHQTTANNYPLRFVRRHPCRNYFHINKLSLAAVESDKSNPSGSDDVVLTSVPSKWLEFKHEYGHRHHHHHEGELFEIDGDKLQMHHHQHKGVGFMRAIRKFLKHAFD